MMTIYVELISLGMTADVVMIIENQNLSARMLATVSIGGTHSANARTDDGHIVSLARISALLASPTTFVAQLVRDRI
nr:hypothetical protein [Croceibacterium soli]